MALTNTEILNVKPQSKAFKLYDELGLFLQVTPSGGKWWRFKYRFDGKEKLLSFGTYPDVSLANARGRRDNARKLLASDPPIDPSESRKTIKAESNANKSNTFELWAGKWWQHWHAGKSERHAEYVKRRLELDVYPAIGKRPINDITAYEIVDTIKGIAERGALDIAKRSHQTIGQIFRYAIAHGKESNTKRNPATDIKPSDIIETRAQVNYARVGIEELPMLLRAIDTSKSTPLTRLAVKLIALTFVRTSELIGARWCEFDLDAGLWRIPPERMKKKTLHIVPLSKQAIEIVNTLKELSCHSELLFPNQNDHSKPMSNNTILKALEVMGYKGKMTGHGFRGIASTQLNEMGYDEKHIEIQLAHLTGNATQRAYDHAKHIPARKLMMQVWADYLDELKAGAKVLPFNKQS
jgi:integrase